MVQLMGIYLWPWLVLEVKRETFSLVTAEQSVACTKNCNCG
jgi:hypothetical protein